VPSGDYFDGWNLAIFRGNATSVAFCLMQPFESATTDITKWAVEITREWPVNRLTAAGDHLCYVRYRHTAIQIAGVTAVNTPKIWRNTKFKILRAYCYTHSFELRLPTDFWVYCPTLESVEWYFRQALTAGLSHSQLWGILYVSFKSWAARCWWRFPSAALFRMLLRYVKLHEQIDSIWLKCVHRQRGNSLCT
jgi:hypothetical protein